MDKSSIIFGNEIPKKIIKKAEKSKKSYQKKYGDDSNVDYKIGFKKINELDFINVNNIVSTTKNEKFPDNALIVGNIRMGFGHYRISIAMASCAHALGYEPYWFDLASFESTGSKMIQAQNNLYSLGSRISQKSKLFNHFIWEKVNRDTFKKITYNATDQKNSENLVPLFKNIPQDIPFIATHAWPSQGAIHAGMKNVVNAIPDNWPMALHLSEGAIHTVQTNFAYYGYKRLDGFSKYSLKHMSNDDLKMVGHYVDHEIVSNLEEDTFFRIKRIQQKEPLRILLSVGGAGAGQKQFLKMVKHLLPYVKDNKVALFINYGDHLNVYEYLCHNIKNFNQNKSFFNQYNEFKDFVLNMNNNMITGIYNIFHQDIFPAVYSTNLLMRKCDVLITKPSELVFYPIPKIFMRHIGGHEVFGAIYDSEIGDGTYECDNENKLNKMLDDFILDSDLLIHMCNQILKFKNEGLYNGAYECVKLATKNMK